MAAPGNIGLAGGLTGAAPRGNLPLLSGRAVVPALRQQTVVTPSLLQQAAQLAQQSANQQTQSTIAAIRQQQDYANQQAQQRAQQISGASLAAANFLKPLGDQTRADYAAAVGQTQALGQGYSGQLRSDADAEAAKAQAMLASVPGNTQTADNKGGSLANLLYGLGAGIPGNALATQGLGAVTAARALPLGTLGYGQQEAYGALGAGKATSDQLQAQIMTALGNKPALQNQLLGQYTNAAQSQQQLDNSTRATNSLIAERNASTKNATTKYNNTLVPTFDPTKSKALGIVVDQFGNPLPDKSGLQQLMPGHHWVQGPDGSVVSQPDVKPSTSKITPNTLASKATGKVSWVDSSGQIHFATLNGQPVAYKGTPKKPGGLSSSSWESAVKSTQSLVKSGALGKPASMHYPAGGGAPTPVPGTGVLPTPYDQAVEQAIQNGPSTAAWKAKATAIVNAHYPLPQLDPVTGAYVTTVAYRPFSGRQAVTLATKDAKRLYDQGIDSESTSAALQAEKVYPSAAVQRAIATVFKPVGAIPWLGIKG